MGLTVSYALSRPSRLGSSEVEKSLEALRDFCAHLPFDEVDRRTRSLRGADLLSSRRRGEFIFGDAYVGLIRDHDGRVRRAAKKERPTEWATARALEILSFTVQPGRGAETAWFCLARLRDSVTVPGGESGEGPLLIDIPEHRRKWLGRWGCKTQYAGHPSFGGTTRFVEVHLGLIAALDEAERLGFGVVVHDDGGYWRKRSVPSLVSELDRWNRIVASIAGKLKDTLADRGMGTIVAPIASRPDFERLEAGCRQSGGLTGAGKTLRRLVRLTRGKW